MFSSDTLQGFNFSPSTFFNPLSGLDSLFSGAENIWKGFTGQSSNEKINAENVAMQQKNLDYQIALQQEIFDREDTAYQRTRADMYNAGLNPLSMKSTNSAGAVVPTQAPQKQFESINSIPIITQALTELNSLSVGQAQRDNINAQTRSIDLQNKFLSDTFDNRKLAENSRSWSAYYDSKFKATDYENYRFTGMRDSSYLDKINNLRLALGKKPMLSNVAIDDKNIEFTNNFDFNELVDNARAMLTADMVGNVTDIIKEIKKPIKIGK